MFDLYLVTDSAAPLGVVETTRRALADAPPGRVGVLVRDPKLSPSALFALVERVIGVASELGAKVLVSHDVAIAARAGADGVHLRESSVSPREARATLGDGALVGAS